MWITLDREHTFNRTVAEAAAAPLDMHAYNTLITVHAFALQQQVCITLYECGHLDLSSCAAQYAGLRLSCDVLCTRCLFSKGYNAVKGGGK